MIFPPWRTVYEYFSAWERERREASPSAGMIDAQSAKSAARVGRRIDPVGYDASKKVKGHKWHVVVDIFDNRLKALVLSANVQERDRARLLLKNLNRLCIWVEKFLVDAKYNGEDFIG